MKKLSMKQKIASIRQTKERHIRTLYRRTKAPSAKNFYYIPTIKPIMFNTGITALLQDLNFRFNMQRALKK